jgi:hypothetical protein
MIGETPPVPDGPAPDGLDPDASAPPREEASAAQPQSPAAPREIGGRDGPDPTRYGDWEKNGRCIDF